MDNFKNSDKVEAAAKEVADESPNTVEAAVGPQRDSSSKLGILSPTTQEVVSMKSVLTTAVTIAVILGWVLIEKMMPGTMSSSEIFGVLDTINRSEIDAAHLANEKATARDVRSFASRMVSEHQRMMVDANELAQRMDVQPQKPALAFTLNGTHQDAMEDLRDQSGSDFDKAYMEYQVKMHEQAMNVVGNAADQVKNFSLKKHLRETRPDLHSHLDSAQSINGE